MRKLTHRYSSTHGYSSTQSMPAQKSPITALRWHWCPYPGCVFMFKIQKYNPFPCTSATSISCSLGLAACFGLPGTVCIYFLGETPLVGSWVMPKRLLGIFQRKCHMSLCHGNPWRWVYYVWYNVSWLEKYRYSKTTHNSATLMRCETTHGIM